MEHAQYFDCLASYPVRHDVGCIRDYEFTCARDTPGSPQARIVVEQGHGIFDGLNNPRCGIWIVLGNVFGFFLEIVQSSS